MCLTAFNSGYIYRHLAGGPDTTGVHAFYDIFNELGKGSFATVMRALCRETGEWWAVKIIHGSRVRSPQAKQKMTAFTREITILETLNHPNICRLKEVFAEDEAADICEIYNSAAEYH